MLKKIVSLALDKLPPTLRPLAAKLAGQLGGAPALKAARALLGKPAAAARAVPSATAAASGGTSPAPTPPPSDSGTTSAPAAGFSSNGQSSADATEPQDVGFAAAATDDTSGSDADDALEPADSAAPDVATVQAELDLELVETLLSHEDPLQEVDAFPGETIDRWGELDSARADFIRGISELPPGRSASVAVENFIPAVLMAVRPVIKLIGRPRVVRCSPG